jgi:histidine triad (HIT) family protein
MEKNSCLFCRIVQGELNTNIVWQDDTALAIRDINPQAPSHILVIPKQHMSDITECKDAKILGYLFQKASLLATQEGLGDGFRLVVNTGSNGGQTINHLHIHLLGGRAMLWPPG